MTIEKILDTALEYQEMGLSVIPVAKNKKPAIKSWLPFQKERADEKQIIQWWNNNPRANIAIVTGSISGITVVDTDSQKATYDFLGQLNDSTPAIATTPRGGSHFYFAYTPELHTCSGALPDTDIRNDGGYIICPPSQNGKGSYTWQEGKSIFNNALPALPAAITNVFNNAFNKGESIRGDVSEHNKAQQSATKRNIFFEKGGRDEALFHLANHLVKSGMPPANIEDYLYFFAANCNPPFPVNEVHAKISSAFQRAKNQERNLTQDVREWVSATWGNFSATSCNEAQQCVTSADKAKIRVILGRLKGEGLIERVEGKNGWYRRVDNECPEVEFINIDTTSINIKLPLGLHDLSLINPNDIILFSGEANSGKSAFLYNIAKDNKDKFAIHWFSSEGGPAEFQKRLKNFDLPLSEWKNIKYHERYGNFADVVKPGKGIINIIDYLELHDEFYKVGGLIADIQKKLDGAIAIIALQKNPGSDVGLGGYRTLEKPRLAVAVSPGKVKIIKAKHWKTFDNPNGMQRKFKLAAGCKFFAEGDWHREQQK